MYFKRLVLAIALCTSATLAIAASCESNFTSTGNFVTGSTYKTFAEMPNVSVESAYQAAYADIAKEPGWKILTGDKANGVIHAVQASSYAKGKNIPLNIVIEGISSGAKISMTYETPAATLSPESAIKSQFCQTIAAAENGTSQPTQAVERDKGTSNQKVVYNDSKQVGVASITPQQQEKISKELAKKTAQKQMQIKIAEASKTIQPYLEKLSCISAGKAMTSLAIYGAPHTFVGSLTGQYPMLGTSYHDKETCLTVAKIHGWTSPALNALAFEVLYLADDSGQTAKESHELVKQPDGEWLFTR